jgi:protein-L-isoaspartate(D-aspartate) O-methyltransferase
MSLSEEEFARQRAAMVETQIVRRGVRDPAVLEVMRTLPRHAFVPEDSRSRAYEDGPIAIGEGQTISQPYIVAAMTAALHLRPTDRVLEIGTGSAYQTAILSRLAGEVLSLEVRPSLARAAAAKLGTLGYTNVRVFERDGSLGLLEYAPYDAILAAAAAPAVPEPLKQQLADNGRLVLPVGAADKQQLQLITRLGTSYVTQPLDACQFVPLIGYYGWPKT